MHGSLVSMRGGLVIWYAVWVLIVGELWVIDLCNHSDLRAHSPTLTIGGGLIVRISIEWNRHVNVYLHTCVNGGNVSHQRICCANTRILICPQHAPMPSLCSALALNKWNYFPHRLHLHLPQICIIIYFTPFYICHQQRVMMSGCEGSNLSKIGQQFGHWLGSNFGLLMVSPPMNAYVDYVVFMPQHFMR